MKKIVIVSFVGLLLMAAIAGCSKPSPSSSEPSSVDMAKLEETLRPVAQKATDHLTLRQYDDVVSMFDDKMKENLPADALKEAWMKVAGNIGKFEEVTEMLFSTANGNPVVNVHCSFTEQKIDIKYIFNDKNQISGLWLNYLNSVDENANYKEYPIVVGVSESLNGLLCLPKDVENPPVVIFVHGSGPSDMNETIGGGNQPFKDLAHGLAEQGIASIRYDKRLLLASDTTKITIQDEVLDDVNTAIEFAKKDERVDKTKIFVLGHSLGGMMTPKIADENKDLAGVISMAGSLRKIEEIMNDQLTELLPNSGLSEDEQKAQLKEAQAEYAKIKALKSPDGEPILGYPASYWYSMSQIDGVSLAKSLEMPILVLQGTADFQVFYDKDYKLWQDTLKDKENAVFHEYDGLNHLMMPTAGKRDITEYDTLNHVDKAVIDDIASFVKGN